MRKTELEIIKDQDWYCDHEYPSEDLLLSNVSLSEYLSVKDPVDSIGNSDRQSSLM